MSVRKVDFKGVSVVLLLGQEPALIVDGIEMAIDRESALRLLFGDKNVRRKKLAEPKKRSNFSKAAISRNARQNKKGLCGWCERKRAPGKKLCRHHIDKLAKNRSTS